jgi:hypothetical protein
MRNLFALVGFAIVAFAGMGWYLGWYNLSRQKGEPGMQSFQVDVNPSKVSSDVKKGAETISEIYDRLSDDKNKADQQAPAATAQPAAGSSPATQFFTPSKSAGNSAAKTSLKSHDTPTPSEGIQPVSATSTSR